MAYRHLLGGDWNSGGIRGGLCVRTPRRHARHRIGVHSRVLRRFSKDPRRAADRIGERSECPGTRSDDRCEHHFRSVDPIVNDWRITNLKS